MQINIGISEAHRKDLAESLSRLLADSYTLYLKTQNYHWNVTGIEFHSLHLLFETQYQELAAAIDLIAERIRALGFPAPASYREFSALTQIKEVEKPTKAQEMVKDLLLGQEIVVKTARDLFVLAEQANDQPTIDLLTERMEAHEKNAWMLRSILG